MSRGSALVIRPAHPEDREGVLTVVESAYRGSGGWTTEVHLVGGTRTRPEEVDALIADPAVTLLVAVDHDRIVGCCMTARSGDRAELGLFAVSPATQGHGIGRRLLGAHVEHQRSAGATAIEIHVLQSRPELHAWYRRLGFVPTGATVPFPGNVADLRTAGLRMEVMELRCESSAHGGSR